MRIVHAVLRCSGIVAVAASAAAACAKSPTSPVAGTWTIDASPFPGYMLVADRVRLQVVVIDSVGGLRPATEGSVMTVSDTRILQLRGDTLIAMSMGRAEVIISGSWQGQALSGRRPVVVAPRPAASLAQPKQK